MKRQLLLIALAVAVVGCAARQPKVWVKAGATDEQFRRDQLTCRQYGMQSAQANGLAGNLFVELWISDRTTECLQSLAYHEVAPASAPAPAQPIAAPVQPAASLSTLAAPSAPGAAPDVERERVKRVLVESGFPVAGEPLRFKQSSGRSFYEARGTQGQITQVVCDVSSNCRLRTAYD